MHDYYRIRVIHVTGVVIRDPELDDVVEVYQLNYTRSYSNLRITTQDMLDRMRNEIGSGRILISSILVGSDLFIPKPDDKYPNAVYYKTNAGYYPVPKRYQFTGEIT